MSDAPVTLSAEGLARREAILARVVATSRSRRRRRTAARGALLVVPVIALAGAVWAVRSTPGPMAPRDLPIAGPVVPPAPATTIRVVATETGIAERWAARAPAAAAERLDDDDLFLILHAEGRATGMIRAGSQVTVVGLQTDDAPRPSGMRPEHTPPARG